MVLCVSHNTNVKFIQIQYIYIQSPYHPQYTTPVTNAKYKNTTITHHTINVDKYINTTPTTQQHNTPPPQEIECLPCVKLIYNHRQNIKQGTPSYVFPENIRTHKVSISNTLGVRRRSIVSESSDSSENVLLRDIIVDRYAIRTRVRKKFSTRCFDGRV